jgi:hypothetical protein
MFCLDGWKKLADLTHLHPIKDFAESCEWFLPYCYDRASLTTDNMVSAFQKLTYENFCDTYDKYYYKYEILRTKIKLDPLSVSKLDSIIRTWTIDKIRRRIVCKEDINTVLWYWDELVTQNNTIDVLHRLREPGVNISLSYGKLVDVMTKTSNKEILDGLVKIAEEKIKTYQIKLAQPVAVFGDRSGSMEVAIKTSGIITSLLCCLCNASLHLFDEVDEHYTKPPRTILDAIKFGQEVKTRGYTAPASSLLYYVKNNERLATIILITDEEENKSSSNGYRFAELYLKYLRDVCIDYMMTKLVFISFTDPNNDGLMIRELKRNLIGQIVHGILINEDKFNELVKVFKFNVKDPDLNRMDIVLKYLSE